MIATGSNAVQISDNRKHLRNNNGEAVNISNETNIVCGKFIHFGIVRGINIYLSLSLFCYQMTTFRMTLRNGPRKM